MNDDRRMIWSGDLFFDVGRVIVAMRAQNGAVTVYLDGVTEPLRCGIESQTVWGILTHARADMHGRYDSEESR